VINTFPSRGSVEISAWGSHESCWGIPIERCLISGSSKRVNYSELSSVWSAKIRLSLLTVISYIDQNCIFLDSNIHVFILVYQPTLFNQGFISWGVFYPKPFVKLWYSRKVFDCFFFFWEFESLCQFSYMPKFRISIDAAYLFWSVAGLSYPSNQVMSIKKCSRLLVKWVESLVKLKLVGISFQMSSLLGSDCQGGQRERWDPVWGMFSLFGYIIKSISFTVAFWNEI
jgi:hypothetical protein